MDRLCRWRPCWRICSHSIRKVARVRRGSIHHGIGGAPESPASKRGEPQKKKRNRKAKKNRPGGTSCLSRGASLSSSSSSSSAAASSSSSSSSGAATAAHDRSHFNKSVTPAAHHKHWVGLKCVHCFSDGEGREVIRITVMAGVSPYAPKVHGSSKAFKTLLRSQCIKPAK